MSALTEKEQTNVRTAIRFLRLKVGAWAPLAKALHFDESTVEKTINGRRGVSAEMAIRVARLAGVGVDEVLEGRYLPSRTCRHCGHPPEDFVDDETVVEDEPRTDGGFRLVPR